MIERAAPLHDVGKVGVPDAILLKPAQLSPGELDIIRTHPAMGARILSGSRVPLLRMAEEIAHAHHERWDGRGYPHGRSGEGIPLAGRIVALADAFDAMTHDRPYKQGIAPERALEVVESERGRHFDPQVVDAFTRVFPNLPATAGLTSAVARPRPRPPSTAMPRRARRSSRRAAPPPAGCRRDR